MRSMRMMSTSKYCPTSMSMISNNSVSHSAVEIAGRQGGVIFEHRGMSSLSELATQDPNNSQKAPTE